MPGPIADWAPYARPDRAEIAARVHAELAAPGAVIGRRELEADTGSAGWDPLGAQEVAELAGMPAAPPPAGRCEACGYLVTALGHYWACR